MASIPCIRPHELLHNLLQKDPNLLAALSGSQLEPGLENFAKQTFQMAKQLLPFTTFQTTFDKSFNSSSSDPR